MNYIQIRQALAELCGYGFNWTTAGCHVKFPHDIGDNGRNTDWLAWTHSRHEIFNQAKIPEYQEDLGWMHEIEKRLTIKEHSDFVQFLFAIVKGADIEETVWLAVHATPGQRAKAVLQAKNLWKND